MTKNFCDICGAPALDDAYVRVQINAGPPWSGSRSEPGHVSCVDGTWQPVVMIETVLQLKDGKRPADRLQPADICAKCRSDVLVALMSKYAVPPEA